MSKLFDTGLQPERTALAWRRTGLALLGGSLVAARILPAVLDAWTAIFGLCGVISASVLLYAIHRRYQRHHTTLTTEGELAPIAGGRLIAITAGFVFAAGILTLAIVIAVHINGRASLGL